MLDTFTSITEPRFYFTAHRAELQKGRTLEDSFIMLVASSFWNNTKKKFNIPTVPSHIRGYSIDSGGFQVAQKYGKYPWTLEQYVQFIRLLSEQKVPEFCASMDYACEQGVNREIIKENTKRIDATIENDLELRRIAPDLPWLSVLQGDSFLERLYDLDKRYDFGLNTFNFYGIGSVCRRGKKKAIEVVKFYAENLPDAKFHAFGIYIQALGDPTVKKSLLSWDSYSWAFARGMTEIRKPLEYFQRDDEDYNQYSRRLALLYFNNTVSKYVTRKG